MSVEEWERVMRFLAFTTAAAVRRFVNNLTPLDALKLDAAFEAWAHRNQLPPSGVGWRVWMMLAGRGYGKTRAGAEWIHRLAMGRPGVRIALVGASIGEARSVMIEGVSGLLSIARKNGHRVKWEPSLGRLTWRKLAIWRC